MYESSTDFMNFLNVKQCKEFKMLDQSAKSVTFGLNIMGGGADLLFQASKEIKIN